MARQTGDTKIIGSFGGLTFYRMWRKYYVRSKSSLSRERVLQAKEFEKSRQNASVFALAVKLAKLVYDHLPEGSRDQKTVWYPLRNKAQAMLRAGRQEAEVLQQLYIEYLEPHIATKAQTEEKKNIHSFKHTTLTVDQLCQQLKTCNAMLRHLLEEPNQFSKKAKTKKRSMKKKTLHRSFG